MPFGRRLLGGADAKTAVRFGEALCANAFQEFLFPHPDKAMLVQRQIKCGSLRFFAIKDLGNCVAIMWCPLSVSFMIAS
jgi:hypothetical protein